MSWPDIPEPATIKLKFVKRQLSTTYDTGRIVSIAADVVGHWEFTLNWPDMEQSDLDLLAAAVESDMGSSFTWKHFYWDSYHTVVYAEDGFDADMTEDYVPGHFNVTVKLLQIPLSTATSTTTTTTSTTTTTA